MKASKARVHSRWSPAPAFVIALLMAGDFVVGAGISQAQVLWGSSSKGAANPSGVFTIDTTTGLATLVGTTGLGDGVGAIRFDLRVDLAVNGEPVSSGVARCVTGLSRRPAAVPVAFDAFPAVSVKAGDVFSLRVSNRMGTNADDTKCKAPNATHTSAVGLRLFYDSSGHNSGFDGTITPSPAETFFLHSDGSACSTPGAASAGVTTRFLDNSAPTATSDKCRDSVSGNSDGVNAWREIGTWILTKS